MRIFILVVFVGLACLLLVLGWLGQPRQVVVKALFQVQGEKPSILGDGSPQRFDDREFEVTKNTQRALLTSPFIFNAAVRSPGIASLSILANQDPVEWLSERLEVDYPQDGEILAIKLRGPEKDSPDLIRIVDAVAEAYKEEVLFAMKQREQSERDLLARTLGNLRTEIKEKDEAYRAALGGSGNSEQRTKTLERLIFKKIDRIDAELAKAEVEQLEMAESKDESRRAILEKRITQLRQQREEAESRLLEQAPQPAGLSAQHREIELLQRLADETAMKLERIDIDSAAPPRIRQLQKAIVESE